LKKTNSGGKNSLGKLARGESIFLLATVFITSICALSYELIIGATGAYIAGDGVKQFAFTIGLFLSSMGIGSFISRKVPTKKALDVFIGSEIAIGLFGGLSHPILYVLYAYTSSYQMVLYLLIVLIGTLTGLEIPLVTRILAKNSSLRLNISNILTLDYLGALFTALLFPIILLPTFGLWQTSLFFGIVNLILAGILIYFIKGTHRRIKLKLLLFAAMSILLVFQVFGKLIIDMADSAAYGEEIVYSETTKYQKIVLTRWRKDLRLYINGNIQFSSFDEYRYHEALIHPLFSTVRHHENVLILGGGDGLALREIFKYKGVKHIDLVDLDPAVVALSKRDPHLKKLNKNSLNDKRVHYHAMDAWLFVRNIKKRYQIIVVDLPDPSNENLIKLYSKQFYQLLSMAVARDGGIVIQATSPYFNRRTFWAINQSVKEAGLRTIPIHAHVPSFGEWGFVLAAKFNLPFDEINLKVKTRYLTNELLPALKYFPKDIGPMPVETSTLIHPTILKYYQEDHRKYFSTK
jgi:spermidine synthase